jgi:hypothetical protein
MNDDRDHPGTTAAPGRSLHRRSVERRDRAARDLLVQRVTAEFREMPCLRVTAEQAERLFGLRSDISGRIISELMEQGLLRLDEDGRYAASDC